MGKVARWIEALTVLSVSLGTAVPLCGFEQPSAKSGDTAAGERLFVVSANLLQQYGASDPVVVHVIGADHQLRPFEQVLRAREGISAGSRWTPAGVYSIHETGNYLIVEYPHPNPSAVTFVPKSNPRELRCAC